MPKTGAADGRHTAPATTGGRLGDIFQEWAVRHAQTQLGQLLQQRLGAVLFGLTDYKLALSTAEYTTNLQFADP
ncbi:MAG: hypothetical protein IPH35_23510 [Rhodoferax sp.]|nr:hypothetical protein [Rhodoferax sp.]